MNRRTISVYSQYDNIILFIYCVYVYALQCVFFTLYMHFMYMQYHIFATFTNITKNDMSIFYVINERYQ